MHASLHSASAWAWVTPAAMLALLQTQMPLPAVRHGTGSVVPPGQRHLWFAVFRGMPFVSRQGKQSSSTVQALPRAYPAGSVFGVQPTQEAVLQVSARLVTIAEDEVQVPLGPFAAPGQESLQGVPSFTTPFTLIWDRTQGGEH